MPVPPAKLLPVLVWLVCGLAPVKVSEGSNRSGFERVEGSHAWTLPNFEYHYKAEMSGGTGFAGVYRTGDSLLVFFASAMLGHSPEFSVEIDGNLVS